jgi:hypothetical protein
VRTCGAPPVRSSPAGRVRHGVPGRQALRVDSRAGAVAHTLEHRIVRTGP